LHPDAHGQSDAGVRPSPRGVCGQPENIGLFSTTSLGNTFRGPAT
jgi:hypothetical protein